MEPAIIVAQPESLRILDLVKNADIVVQAVMATLAIASIICWAIIVEKIVQLVAFGSQVRGLERAIRPPLEMPPDGAWLARAILSEARHADINAGASLLEQETRLERAMRLAVRPRLNAVRQRVRFLATVGSTAPFIGLFGTVWGIMNSFTAIAQQKDTSLAVVAPGIAEALFATALGLVAAIPAVIAYNQISGSIARASDRINMAVASLSREVLRANAKD